MIECRGVCTGYPETAVSANIDLRVRRGEFLSVIGPNGCGKTTLLKTMAGLLPLTGGSFKIDGCEVNRLSERTLARYRAYLPQLREAPDITVGALVAHGRFPYLGFSRKLGEQDKRIVEQAMQRTGVLQWRMRKVKQLSGGERQRVYLAMTIAQETPLLLWDEPTTYLDINHRLAIMDLAKELHRDGKTIVMTLHDLSDALTLSDRVCLMDSEGNIRTTDTPEALFHSGEIDRVFGVHSEQVRLSSGGVSYVFTPKQRDVTEEGI